MTITEFLLARIAEDEAAARASSFDPHWTDHPEDLGQPIKDARGARLATCAESVMAHIARHDPARVLAECEAKRRIVTLGTNGLVSASAAVQILAAVYSDHPDYDEAWLA